ncbi:MAG TPA: glycine zipper 2TM domain-containing protein [Rhodanobacter sp.]
MNARSSKFAMAAVMVAGIALAGCVTAPYGNQGNYNRGNGYQGQQGNYGNRNMRCQSCGVVQDVQQVYISGGNRNGGTLGAVIGAVAGGVLGSTIGKGDGRTAATVGGAVAGGVIGNQVGKRSDGDSAAWRIVVRLDNGQYATVTQRDNPGFRNGDYVEIRGDQVYPR